MELQRKTGLTYQKVSFITDVVNSFVAPPAVLVIIFCLFNFSNFSFIVTFLI